MHKALNLVFKGKVVQLIFLLTIYALFFWLMLKITFQYLPFNSGTAFLQIKQTEVIHVPGYLLIFYIPVCSPILTLFAGFTQFSDTLANQKVEEEERVNISYSTATEAVHKINGSTRLLKAEELKNLRKLDLELIRNTIFARHGYIFKNKRMRQFFDYIDWYIPVKAEITNDLTPIEKQNISMIQRFENYATKHYDSFGR